VERLRFDFSHPTKLTDEERGRVESIVNDQIQKNLTVGWEEMSVEEARDAGAVGLFEERYGDRVKVYSIGDFSREICGGPHVESTGDLGQFRIVKEQSVGSGMRRIRAILEGPG
jgi:alanyl-tRNA synthetase